MAKRGEGWWAPALLLAAALASSAIHQRARTSTLAGLALLLYAASLCLGPSLAYPVLRRAGAGPRRAAVGALLVPLAWIAKESWRVGGVFGPGGALYYAANPLALGLLWLAGVQMAAAELLLRGAHGGSSLRGPGLLVAALLGVAAVVAWFGAGSGGSELFYGYVALHGRLFGE